jgi:hypothetical protein
MPAYVGECVLIHSRMAVLGSVGQPLPVASVVATPGRFGALLVAFATSVVILQFTIYHMLSYGTAFAR